MQRIVSTPQNLIPFTDAQVGIAPVETTVPYLDTMTISGLMVWGGSARQCHRQVGHCVSSGGPDFMVAWKTHHSDWFEYERDRQNWHFPGLAIGVSDFQDLPGLSLGLPGCAPGLSAAACAASAAAGITNGTPQSNISIQAFRRGLRHRVAKTTNTALPTRALLCRMTSKSAAT